MGQSNKKRKQQQRNHGHEQINIEPPNQEILDIIGSPNAWTPKVEDAWLKELGKISAVEIYRRFPPLKKPGNVSLRGRTRGG